MAGINYGRVHGTILALRHTYLYGGRSFGSFIAIKRSSLQASAVSRSVVIVFGGAFFFVF